LSIFYTCFQSFTFFVLLRCFHVLASDFYRNHGDQNVFFYCSCRMPFWEYFKTGNEMEMFGVLTYAFIFQYTQYNPFSWRNNSHDDGKCKLHVSSNHVMWFFIS
jgi:hypothetical protein